MKVRAALLLVVMTVALARLPLLGARLAGHDEALFQEPLQPPGLVRHAPTSWPLVAVGAALLLLMLLPVLRRLLRPSPPATLPPGPRAPFPAYGWAGLALALISWAVAWGAVPSLLAGLRPYTFAPLWTGYVLVVLAWTKRRAGRNLLDEPRRLWGLTAVSAVFWWFFEYLNRFVESWSYSQIDLDGPLAVLLFGVLPFATVLPAVAATSDLLRTVPRIDAAFGKLAPVQMRLPRVLGALVAAGGLLGLTGLSLAPNVLFPLVWLAPLLVLTGAQAALGMPHIFSRLGRGDGRRLVTWALAALICGVFWEGWNWLSLARWTYAVPFVDQPRLFEMPLLGYAGYLPFGWECEAVAELIAPERRT
ncbi:MAG: hypothetical protein QM765_42945 [Myxococcales bacterium]